MIVFLKVSLKMLEVLLGEYFSTDFIYIKFKLALVGCIKQIWIITEQPKLMTGYKLSDICNGM